MGRPRPRHPAVPPRHHGRPGIHHGCRGSHSRRRLRLVGAPLRAGVRQPALGGPPHGGRQTLKRGRRALPRAVLGPARRRRQLRGGDVVDVRPASASGVLRRAPRVAGGGRSCRGLALPRPAHRRSRRRRRRAALPHGRAGRPRPAGVGGHVVLRGPGDLHRAGRGATGVRRATAGCRASGRARHRGSVRGVPGHARRSARSAELLVRREPSKAARRGTRPLL